MFGQECFCIRSGRGAVDRDAQAVRSVSDCGNRALAVDQDRKRNPAHAAQLKAVTRSPGGIGLPRGFGRRFLRVFAIE